MNGRRWLRFRLRTLLALIAVCAVPSWFASHIIEYRAEQRVLAELRKAGADFQIERSFTVSDASPWEEWLTGGTVVQAANPLSIFC